MCDLWFGGSIFQTITVKDRDWFTQLTSSWESCEAALELTEKDDMRVWPTTLVLNQTNQSLYWDVTTEKLIIVSSNNWASLTILVRASLTILVNSKEKTNGTHHWQQPTENGRREFLFSSWSCHWRTQVHSQLVCSLTFTATCIGQRWSKYVIDCVWCPFLQHSNGKFHVWFRCFALEWTLYPLYCTFFPCWISGGYPC